MMVRGAVLTLAGALPEKMVQAGSSLRRYGGRWIPRFDEAATYQKQMHRGLFDDLYVRGRPVVENMVVEVDSAVPLGRGIVGALR